MHLDSNYPNRFSQPNLLAFSCSLLFENPREKLPKGASLTQYIVGIVADQSSKMAATIIGLRTLSPIGSIRNTECSKNMDMRR